MPALFRSRIPTPTAGVRPLDVRTLLWVVERLSRHFALPVDGAETLRSCPPPCSDAQLHERLLALGLSIEVTRAAMPDADSLVVAWTAERTRARQFPWLRGRTARPASFASRRSDTQAPSPQW